MCFLSVSVDYRLAKFDLRDLMRGFNWKIRSRYSLSKLGFYDEPLLGSFECYPLLTYGASLWRKRTPP